MPPSCAQVRYLGLVEQLKRLVVDPVLALSAAVYTELSDVEAEINGLTTYDRQVYTCSPQTVPPDHQNVYDLDVLELTSLPGQCQWFCNMPSYGQSQ